MTSLFIVLMVGNLVFLFSPFLKLSPFFRSSRASAPCTYLSEVETFPRAKWTHFKIYCRCLRDNRTPAQGLMCLMQPKGPPQQPNCRIRLRIFLLFFLPSGLRARGATEMELVGRNDRISLHFKTRWCNPKSWLLCSFFVEHVS